MTAETNRKWARELPTKSNGKHGARHLFCIAPVPLYAVRYWADETNFKEDSTTTCKRWLSSRKDNARFFQTNCSPSLYGFRSFRISVIQAVVYTSTGEEKLLYYQFTYDVRNTAEFNNNWRILKRSFVLEKARKYLEWQSSTASLWKRFSCQYFPRFSTFSEIYTCFRASQY